MTLNDAFEGHSLRTTQLVQRGSLLLLAITASLILAFHRHNGFMLGVVMALGTVVVPTVYVVARRLIEKVRQREAEERIMMYTRRYLQTQEPARDAIAKPAVESDIEILARAIDGRRLPMQDFRKFDGIASLLPVGEPVVFDALPHRYATLSRCERLFAEHFAALPGPAKVPLSGARLTGATQPSHYTTNVDTSTWERLPSTTTIPDSVT